MSSTSIVRAQHWPAAVVSRGRPTLRRVFVVLAEGGEQGGLWAWSRPDVLAPGWAFPLAVDWGRAQLPGRELAWRSGVEVPLVDGTSATITTGGGCRCGALRGWAGPSWATTVAAR